MAHVSVAPPADRASPPRAVAPPSTVSDRPDRLALRAIFSRSRTVSKSNLPATFSPRGQSPRLESPRMQSPQMQSPRMQSPHVDRQRSGAQRTFSQRTGSLRSASLRSSAQHSSASRSASLRATAAASLGAMDAPDRVSPVGVASLGRSRTAPKGIGLELPAAAGGRSVCDAGADGGLARARTAPRGADALGEAGRRRSLREVSRAISLSLRRAGSQRGASGGGDAQQQAMLQCSLAELSETYLSRAPKFYARPFAPDAPHSPGAALSLVHNAAQKELVALVGRIVPGCLRAAGGAVAHPLRRADAMRALARWWAGFADFSLFVARAEAAIVEAVFARFMRDEHLMYDKRETAAAEKQRAKVAERASFTIKLVLAAAQETIAEGVEHATPERFMRVVQAVNIVINFLLETYDLSNVFIRYAEARLRKNRVTGIVKQTVRLVEQCEDVPLCTLILVRWMDDPKIMASWARRNLSRTARKNLQMWQDVDNEDRSAALETIMQTTA